jgi:dipeptidyl aminopeptidase/acylaminoacyl peptidase
MRTLHGLIVGLLLSACAAEAIAADSAAVRRTLTPDDLLRVQEVSDPQLSPDGAWVAYVVGSNDRDADEARSAIWMVSWDGRERLPLTSAANGTGNPTWSPDGRYLAFIATPAGSDKGQIMLLDRRGGEARQLTSVTGEIGAYAWSPDGRRLVIALEQGDEGNAPKPIVIDAWHFKQDEDGYLRAGHGRHLYLLDIESKQMDALTADPEFNEDLPAWAPDGRQIAFTRSHEAGADRDGRTDIDVIEARPGATARSIVRPYAPNKQRLAWSPDGTRIAYLQGREPKFNAYMQDRLFLVLAAGGAPRALTDKLDRAVTSMAFTDNASLMIAVEDDGTVYPARVDLGSGAISRATPAGAFVISALTSAGGHTALLQTNDTALAEVYALEGDQLRRLSAHNDTLLSELALGPVEDFRFRSTGGTEVDGLIVKPPFFVPGRKYPTLLWIHGGPNEQEQHSLALDSYEFEKQLFAANGFVVLRVNYRGGSGRGAEFAQAIYADWGHKEVEDLLAGVDRLVALGIADKERLAIGGWSYGGLLTDYTIASDRRFKAAISGAGSGNQLSTYGSDEYILQYDNEIGTPWSKTALWIKLSYPFFHAARIHTPTLFLGGDKDFNVPIIGGEQMYQALRTLGVPTQLVVYPGQHHLLTRPSFVKDLAERMSAWIDRYIEH